jgi:hypothetical protein
VAPSRHALFPRLPSGPPCFPPGHRLFPVPLSSTIRSKGSPLFNDSIQSFPPPPPTKARPGGDPKLPTGRRPPTLNPDQQTAGNGGRGDGGTEWRHRGGLRIPHRSPCFCVCLFLAFSFDTRLPAPPVVPRGLQIRGGGLCALNQKLRS